MVDLNKNNFKRNGAESIVDKYGILRLNEKHRGRIRS